MKLHPGRLNWNCKSLSVSCSPGWGGNWAAVLLVLAFPLVNDSTGPPTLRDEIVGRVQVIRIPL